MNYEEKFNETERAELAKHNYRTDLLTRSHVEVSCACGGWRMSVRLGDPQTDIRLEHLSHAMRSIGRR